MVAISVATEVNTNTYVRSCGMVGVPLIPSSSIADPKMIDVGSWWVSFTVCHAIITTNSVLLTLCDWSIVLLEVSRLFFADCFVEVQRWFGCGSTTLCGMPSMPDELGILVVCHGTWKLE